MAKSSPQPQEPSSQARPRLLIVLAIGGAIALPTLVAEAVLANLINTQPARQWALIGVFALALLIWAIAAWLVRSDAKLFAVERQLRKVVRRLTPSREWGRTAVEALASAVIATAIALILAGLFPSLHLEVEAGVAILTFLAVLVVMPQLSRFGRLALYGKLDKISREAEGPGHDVIMEVLERILASFNETLRGLKSETGLPMNRADIIAWTLRCFENAHKRYRGADSSVPSVYRNRYPTYLDSHQVMLERLDKQGRLQDPGERILIAATEPLRHDRVVSRQTFEEFLSWHQADGDTDNNIRVPLNCITPERAREIATEHRLPTTDVAVWDGQYALLFMPTDDEQHTVRMCFGDESDLYPRCVAYLDMLAAEARPIDEVMNLFPDEMAEAWSRYVNEERRQEAMSEILLELLDTNASPRILDAAAGLGTETDWLLRNGFRDVVSNEIEPQFNERLRGRLRSHGIPYENTLYSYDWRELDQRFPPEVFSAILLLGNSLCLVADLKDIQRSLAAFKAVLAPGGRLIIDERNWHYFYANRAKLLSEPFKYYVAPKSMYYGEDVSSIPIEIEGDEANSPRIRLLFYRNGNVKDMEAARDSDHFIGEIDMYPMLNPSLPQLLEAAGFELERCYSDLRKTTAPDSNGTFFTYVARKPGRS